MRAPDYAEPFRAWRVWRVVRRDRGYYLGSVVQRTVWPAGEAFTAECLRMPTMFSRLRRRQRHESPEADCDCGIYAASLERLDHYLADAPLRAVARVLGQVALWGTVIECENGFRASHAYPLRIYVPADAGGPWRIGWDEVAGGLVSYGVPVEPLAARAAEATRHLHDRQAA
ncbi:MAG TPA: hypothetical protein VLD16_06105 [Gaiellaceae bacterium]|nr:hypothetical protein [Gaiellaceae bacterium]